MALSRCLFFGVQQTGRFSIPSTRNRFAAIDRNFQLAKRFQSNERSERYKKILEEQALHKKSVLYYTISAAVVCVGLTYAAVPLYRLFCQSTGYGGALDTTQDAEKVANMRRVEDTVLTIKFIANVNSAMRWNFKPLQSEIKVLPGETALAFYTARNPTDQPVVGVSTYNVLPFEAGPYFNKIQCFCFEAQQLNPHEEVDMPVFFYIDPEFVDDPMLDNVDEIILSYTFFESKDGLGIPVPSYARPH